MKMIIDKLRNNTGETIGETLVALLVSSLALVMLAGAIATSSGIITKSSDKIESYYDKNNELVTMSSAPGDGSHEYPKTGVLTIKYENSYSENVNVNYSVNSEFRQPVTAFKKISESH